MCSRPLVHKFACTLDHGNYQVSWILVWQLIYFFFFCRSFIPVSVKSQVYVLNQSHVRLIVISLLMATCFGSNCELLSGQMMACWWWLTETKHIAVSKLIMTSVLCDWFNTYTCDSLSASVLCNGWSQLYM